MRKVINSKKRRWETQNRCSLEEITKSEVLRSKFSNIRPQNANNMIYLHVCNVNNQKLTVKYKHEKLKTKKRQVAFMSRNYRYQNEHLTIRTHFCGCLVPVRGKPSTVFAGFAKLETPS